MHNPDKTTPMNISISDLRKYTKTYRLTNKSQVIMAKSMRLATNDDANKMVFTNFINYVEIELNNSLKNQKNANS